MLAYRTTPHTTTGIAPTQLLYNREVQTTVPSMVNEKEINYRKVHEKARKNATTNRAKAKAYADVKRARNVDLKVGMKVLVKNKKKTSSPQHLMQNLSR